MAVWLVLVRKRPVVGCTLFFTKLSAFDMGQKWNADAPHTDLLDKRGFLFF